MNSSDQCTESFVTDCRDMNDAIADATTDKFGEDLAGFFPKDIHDATPDLTIAFIVASFREEPSEFPGEITVDDFKKRCDTLQIVVKSEITKATKKMKLAKDVADEFLNKFKLYEEEQTVSGDGHMRLTGLGWILVDMTDYPLHLDVRMPLLDRKNHNVSFYDTPVDVLKAYGSEILDKVVKDEKMMEVPCLRSANMIPKGYSDESAQDYVDVNLGVLKEFDGVKSMFDAIQNGEGASLSGLNPDELELKHVMLATMAIEEMYDRRHFDALINKETNEPLKPGDAAYETYEQAKNPEFTSAKHQGVINLVRGYGDDHLFENKADMKYHITKAIRDIKEEDCKDFPNRLDTEKRRRYEKIFLRSCAHVASRCTMGKNISKHDPMEIDFDDFMEKVQKAASQPLDSTDELDRLVEDLFGHVKEEDYVKILIGLLALAVQSGKTRLGIIHVIFSMAMMHDKYGIIMLRDKGGREDAKQLHENAIRPMAETIVRRQKRWEDELERSLLPSIRKELFKDGSDAFWQKYFPEFEAIKALADAEITEIHNNVDGVLRKVVASETNEKQIIICNGNCERMRQIAAYSDKLKAKGYKGVLLIDEADLTQTTPEDIRNGHIITNKGDTAHKTQCALHLLLRSGIISKVTFSTATATKLIQNFKYFDNVVYWNAVCKRETKHARYLTVEESDSPNKSTIDSLYAYLDVNEAIVEGNTDEIEGSVIARSADGDEPATEILGLSKKKDLHSFMLDFPQGAPRDARKQIAAAAAERLATMEKSAIVMALQGTRTGDGVKVTQFHSARSDDVTRTVVIPALKQMGVKFTDNVTHVFNGNEGKYVADLFAKSGSSSMTAGSMKSHLVKIGKMVSDVTLDNLFYWQRWEQCKDRERVIIKGLSRDIDLPHVGQAFSTVCFEFIRNVHTIVEWIAMTMQANENVDVVNLQPSDIRGGILALDTNRVHKSIAHMVRHLKKAVQGEGWKRKIYFRTNQRVCNSYEDLCRAVNIAITRKMTGLFNIRDFVRKAKTKADVIGKYIGGVSPYNASDGFLIALHKLFNCMKEQDRGVERKELQTRISDHHEVFQFNSDENQNLTLAKIVAMLCILAKQSPDEFPDGKAPHIYILPDKASARGISWHANLTEQGHFFDMAVKYLMTRCDVDSTGRELPRFTEESAKDYIKNCINYTCELSGQIIHGAENRQDSTNEQNMRLAGVRRDPNILFTDNAYVLTSSKSYDAITRATASAEQYMQKVSEFGYIHDKVVEGEDSRLRTYNNAAYNDMVSDTLVVGDIHEANGWKVPVQKKYKVYNKRKAEDPAPTAEHPAKAARTEEAAPLDAKCIILREKIINHVRSTKDNTPKTAREWQDITGLCDYKSEHAYNYAINTTLSKEHHVLLRKKEGHLVWTSVNEAELAV